MDTALAVLLFGSAFVGTMLRANDRMQTVSPWPGMAFSAVGCVAIMWRRQYPQLVLIVTGLCATGMVAFAYLPTVLLLGPLVVALYSLAARARSGIADSWSLGVVAMVLTTAYLAGPASESVLLKVVAPTAWLLLPVAIGTAIRQHRSYLEAERARAEYAEQAREEEAQHRVAEERMRIARELHDVVAHHLALANAQATTAAHLIDSDPQQARTLITQLGGTTSAALRELKATVGLMRQAGEPDAPLEPAPGLAQLPGLAAAFKSSGLEVAVITEGRPQPLSAGVDLTAYRIVQEALTNVSKHARAKSAQVRLVYLRDTLSITVTDDGPGDPRSNASLPGYGLIGMRERAQSVGGRLRTGHRPTGGFEVATELPIEHGNSRQDGHS